MAGESPVLDEWVGRPAVRTVHRRSATADPDALWDAARSVRLSDTRRLGRVVRWRIPDLAADLTFHELFRVYPFALLEEGERHSVSGLCGRIWTLARDYPRLDSARSFAGWDEPGTVRVLFGHWVDELGDGRAELVSEARVEPMDRRASVRLKALWAMIGPLESLVSAEPLEIAVRRAEAS